MSLSAQLLEQVLTLPLQEGMNETALPRVQFYRDSKGSSCPKTLYEPTMVFMFQGRKINAFGSQRLDWNPNHILTVTLPIPMESEIVGATPERPFLGMSLALDMTELAEIMQSLPVARDHQDTFRVMERSDITAQHQDALMRLIRLLKDPTDAQILGPQVCRELVYYTLKSSPDGVLSCLLHSHGQKLRVAQIVKTIHTDPARKIDIDSLIGDANMGKSTFFALFKEMTAHSPIQYQKSIRLHRARGLILNEGYAVSEAAYKVGYSTAAQFSRDYTRFFSMSAKEELQAQTGRRG